MCAYIERCKAVAKGFAVSVASCLAGLSTAVGASIEEIPKPYDHIKIGQPVYAKTKGDGQWHINIF